MQAKLTSWSFTHIYSLYILPNFFSRYFALVSKCISEKTIILKKATETANYGIAY